MRCARVFISCGQKTEREVQIGKAVQDHFRQRGFEAYFAGRVHSPDGLTENIFNFLRKSEYFIFIDFKRDKISAAGHRGSLFVNQELAIATFLRLPGVGFTEKGTMREGILDYHIHNAYAFEDGTEIITRLEEETKAWDKHSVNELEICHSPTVSKNVILNNHPQRPLTDWFHLVIRNRHKNKHAFSCIGYVTGITDLVESKKYEVPSVELLWSGIRDIKANIIGGASREIDAFYKIHDEGKLRFHQRPLGTANPNYRLPDLPSGEYSIEYTIISSNFETASRTFLLKFADSDGGIEFTAGC